MTIDHLAKYVPMEGMDTTSATDEKPLIGTSALASCAGIAVYDPERKVGGAAHVFFNQKESLVHYMRDAQGREIPSTGREVIIDNPRSFDPFLYNAQALVHLADSRGGHQYNFIAFNIDHGCRTQAQNQQLKEVVERTIGQLREQGKLLSAEYRPETDFLLDTRNGRIFSFHDYIREVSRT